MKSLFARLGWSYRILSGDQARDLLSSSTHDRHALNHRAKVLFERIRFFSAFFAIAVPLWIVVDYFLIDGPVFDTLAISRLLSCVVFLLLAKDWKIDETIAKARLFLALMLLNPIASYTVFLAVTPELQDTSIASGIGAIYSLLPFITVAGLALFPLTIGEVFFASLPVLILTIFQIAGNPGFHPIDITAMVWLMVVITAIAAFSAASQLHYFLLALGPGSYDVMTGALTRRAGIADITNKVQDSVLHHRSFALLLVKLENLKEINADYGYEAGDQALWDVSNNMQALLRKDDTLIRWTKDSFLLVFAGTDETSLNTVIDKLMHKGFGVLPDGSPLSVIHSHAIQEIGESVNWRELLASVESQLARLTSG
jgi:GGDEF domain-containing protein